MTNIKLAELALERVSGSDFEAFFHAFYPALAGIDFIPSGGSHDGGSDAFQDRSIFEPKRQKPGSFYQASIERNYRQKIRHTVRRLIEFGREPTVLTYVTSRIVANIDQEEELLHTELSVIIKIRDGKWIAANINSSSATEAAFQTYLQPTIAFLGEFGGSSYLSTPNMSSTRALCVFLGQEVDRRRGKSDILEAVTDSLILWALEGTNPDLNKFLSKQEILSKVELALPAAKHFIRGIIDRRLSVLSAKGNPSGREIRWYRKENKFCLPFDMREMVREENAEDEHLKFNVTRKFVERAGRHIEPGSSSISSEEIAELAHQAVEMTFEKEGLELAAFVAGEGNDRSYESIADQVEEVVDRRNLSGEDAVVVKEIILAVLREAFYTSSAEERLYFGKLARTYTLLFTIQNEPRIVDYFRTMSADFVLYVGADILVRALSERYLRQEDQMTVNMLNILRDAGSSLVLTEAALEEVHSHLEGTDWEFQNYFMTIEPFVTKELVRHTPKILIRSYFYARIDPLLDERPAGWRSFIDQMCNYEDLHSQRGRKQLQTYLQVKFGMEFVSHADLSQLADEGEVEKLARRIRPDKKDEVLAVNDARQILAVYGNRKKIGEEHKPNPFGYRTWWFTHEARVRRHTGELVRSAGAQYIMRPEFILNFIALSANTEEVRRSYATIFPTLLGVRLSSRMREEVFHHVMEKVKRAQEVDDARAQVMVSELSNQLKGDLFRRYEVEFEGEQNWDTGK